MRPDLLERVLRPRWPPVVALLVAAVIFVGVLLATPGSLLAPVLVFVQSDAQVGTYSAAYAAGAAATLALLALVVLAPALALLDLLVRDLLARAARRALARGTDQRPPQPGPMDGREDV